MNGKSILVFAASVAFAFFLVHFINRWQTKRIIKNILRDIKEGKPSKPRNYDFEIVFDSQKVSVCSLKNESANPCSISWNKTNRVTAFKRDLFSVDCICLLFETTDGMTFEVNEDMKGWLKLLEAMPTHLSGSKPFADWIFDVASPAFAPNPTEIFSRH
jgi:hypothetical protein